MDGGPGMKRGVPLVPCANEATRTPLRRAGVRRMSKGTEPSAAVPAAAIVRDVLTHLAREGARRMLAMALEDEVAAW